MLRDGITAGCLNGNYCPNDPVTRAQMAVFLLRGEHGGAYVPPPATGTIFFDVGATDFAADWIEQLYAEGITGGCAGPSPQTGNLPTYCPNAAVQRGQMAVFLLKVYEGVGHVPPPATGVFPDCPPGDPSLAPLVPWIEELARLQVTVGCGNGDFCPNQPNTRGQMAVFMTKTFHRPEGIRFLEQATWGPSDSAIGGVLGSGYLGWLGGQYSLFNSAYPPMRSVARLGALDPGRLHDGHLPARQLHDVSPADRVLQERDVQPGPASPARRLGAAQGRSWPPP